MQVRWCPFKGSSEAEELVTTAVRAHHLPPLLFRYIFNLLPHSYFVTLATSSPTAIL